MSRLTKGLSDKDALAVLLHHFAIPEPNTGCLLWMRSVSDFGYALGPRDRFSSDRLSRVVLERKIGRLLVGDECSLHSCDTPACLNEDHLRVGTRTDNNQDMQDRRRGRAPRGQEAVSNKLTDAQVQDIRHRLNTEKISQRRIAKQYGVSHTTVRKIVIGKKWAWLT